MTTTQRCTFIEILPGGGEDRCPSEAAYKVRLDGRIPPAGVTSRRIPAGETLRDGMFSPRLRTAVLAGGHGLNVAPCLPAALPDIGPALTEPGRDVQSWPGSAHAS